MITLTKSPSTLRKAAPKIAIRLVTKPVMLFGASRIVNPSLTFIECVLIVLILYAFSILVSLAIALCSGE